MLGNGADLLNDRWRGDLRKLRDEGGRNTGRIISLLRAFPGIGPAGADIFLREVQAVWPSVFPYVDERVLAAASTAGLPRDPDKLAKLAGSGPGLARLTAALLRASRGSRS
jgi:hypothetical protein